MICSYGNNILIKENSPLTVRMIGIYTDKVLNVPNFIGENPVEF